MKCVARPVGLYHSDICARSQKSCLLFISIHLLAHGCFAGEISSESKAASRVLEGLTPEGVSRKWFRFWGKNTINVLRETSHPSTGSICDDSCRIIHEVDCNQSNRNVSVMIRLSLPNCACRSAGQGEKLDPVVKQRTK